MKTSLPRAKVLVLRAGRPQDTDPCRASVQAQDYPRDRLRIEVVDVRPAGRAAAINGAVRLADADVIGLVDGHSRVHPRWLAEMVSAADRHQASAVASGIRDWTGDTVDVAVSGISFTGQPNPGTSTPNASLPKSGHPLLFARGGSALFTRAAFLEAGGFDDAFFGLVGGSLEDVDLGWRLNLLGHSIAYAPEAVAYRGRPAAAAPWDGIRQLRLVERNALAMIYKNYEGATLEHVFPVAIALMLLKGLMGSGIDTLVLNLSSKPRETVDVTPQLVARLMALEDFHRQLPALREKRQFVQERRRRSDAEIAPLFGDSLGLPSAEEPLASVARALIADFGVDRIFAKGSRSSQSAGESGVPAPSAHAVLPEPPATSLQSPTRAHAETPVVSIVILTAIGATHVRECLESLRQQTYPLDRIEIIVVDNNSAEDPTAVVERSYPGARVIRNASNVGFAAGNNVGAAVATGDYLVFLNDDTRVHTGWLAELVETAHRRGAASVASFIVDWSGKKVDFVDGAVNFQGKGFQLDYDAPVDSLSLAEKPMLFACGCAMLIDRAVFADAGGWDEGTFAYYEDVELGWRLNLLGHAVWFSPRSIVHHKHHGTSGRWPEPPRTRLYERNSLRMIYELLDLGSLARALPASLLLAADRALLSTPLSRATDVPAGPGPSGPPAPRMVRLKHATKMALVARGVNRRMSVVEAASRVGVRGLVGVARAVLMPPPPVTETPPRRAAYLAEYGDVPAGFETVQAETLSIDTAAILSGIYGFLVDIPAVTKRRHDVQRRRRVTDEEIVGQFGSHWRQQVPARFQHAHDELLRTLIEEFELDRRTVTKD